jgi:uncharacterized protein YbbC (DUF1343 family)
LAEQVGSLAGLRVGLVTNAAATTAALPAPLTPSRLALQKAGVNLTTLFSPEHGLGADAADGAGIANAMDPLTGLPIHSLYGSTYRPTPAMLSGLDLLLFDIPDIGARFYTYIWTLSYVMETCAEVGLPLWVLDRPNPLGGNLAAAEGPLLDERHISTFVGRWAMPIRHSLTIGELARWWNADRNLGVDLAVVALRGWRRSQQWPALGLPFIPTSPAMPSYETALLYPGVCLFEGTNLSEGRGTALPFQVAGAPWLDGIALADAVNALKLPGLRARAVHFTPSVSKYAGESCQGVMLHTIDASALRPVAMGLHLLATIIALHPDDFAWLAYPTAANAPGFGHFDRLIGRPEIRQAIEARAGDHAGQIAKWTAAPGWRERVSPHLLYE